MCREGTACVYVRTQGLGVLSKAANSPSCDVHGHSSNSLAQVWVGISSALSWAVEGGVW